MEDEKFEKLVKSFYTYLTEDKHEYLSLFSRLQIQIEGWFKGELMCHFERQKIALTNKDREVTVDSEKSNNKEKKDKVDLKIELNNETYWIELKHILIGYQRGESYTLGFYFSEDTFVYSDIKKLHKIISSNPQQHGYSLVFLSTNYLNEDGKECRVRDILHTKQNLNDMYKKLTNLKDGPYISKNTSLELSDYNDQRNFGYLLIKVNNDSAP